MERKKYSSCLRRYSVVTCGTVQKLSFKVHEHVRYSESCVCRDRNRSIEFFSTSTNITTPSLSRWLRSTYTLSLCFHIVPEVADLLHFLTSPDYFFSLSLHAISTVMQERS